MDINEAKNILMELQSKMSAYMHAMELIYYDEATYAPKKTAKNREHALAVLSSEFYQLATGKETIDMLEFLDERKEELNIPSL